MSISIQGIWNGTYFYNQPEYIFAQISILGSKKYQYRKLQWEELKAKYPTEIPIPDKIPFVLDAKKGWFNKITGTIQDDESVSTLKGLARFSGNLYETEFRFRKYYPKQEKKSEHYNLESRPDGTIFTLSGLPQTCYYHGYVIGPNEIRGTWLLLPLVIRIKNVEIKLKETVGTFHMYRDRYNETTEHAIYEFMTLEESHITQLANLIKL